MDYKDVVLFAKHYGTLFKKRKSAFMKKVDKLEALACAVSSPVVYTYIIKIDTLYEALHRYSKFQ